MSLLATELVSLLKGYLALPSILILDKEHVEKLLLLKASIRPIEKEEKALYLRLK